MEGTKWVVYHSVSDYPISRGSDDGEGAIIEGTGMLWIMRPYFLLNSDV